MPNKESYGDVSYADPGYQKDGVKRYPLDTEAHVRAAWSYIHMPKNQRYYSKAQLKNIMDKIISAGKKLGIKMEVKNMMTDEVEEDENLCEQLDRLARG